MRALRTILYMYVLLSQQTIFPGCLGYQLYQSHVSVRKDTVPLRAGTGGQQCEHTQYGTADWKAAGTGSS